MATVSLTSTLQSLHWFALPLAEERSVRGAVAVAGAEAAELGRLAASAAAVGELRLRKPKLSSILSCTDVAAGAAAAVFAPTASSSNHWAEAEE